jgi:hypothetical protein
MENMGSRCQAEPPAAPGEAEVERREPRFAALVALTRMLPVRIMENHARSSFDRIGQHQI